MSAHSTEKAQKCVGLWGRIFGHRFTKHVGGYVYGIDYCGRCGMRPWSVRYRPGLTTDGGAS